MIQEVWKDINGYEGCYQVSNLGSVRSLTRIIFHSRWNKNITRSGKQFNLGQKTTKYHTVRLCKNDAGVYVHVHRLVAEAFIENKEAKEQVNHIDGDMKNNHVSNLEWVTRKENGAHASRTGLYRTGERHQNSRIVLNGQTGIFYFSVREAAQSCNISNSMLVQRLLGYIINKTDFVYV